MKTTILIVFTLLFIGLSSAKSRADDAPPAVPVSVEVQFFKDLARPLNSPADLDPLMQRVGDARLVLLGEASHGSSEFYTWRDVISRRLITEKGFRFIVVEGDWASLYRLNRYVKGMETPYESARDIMRTFQRWPQWMWANEETADLIEWLKLHNAGLPFEDRIGFYGMDVYGEDVSLQKTIEQLRAFDPELAAAVAQAYACLEAYGGNMHNYARAVAFDGAESCAPRLEEAYRLLQNAMSHYEGVQQYEFFAIKQNAKVVKNAEAHYRLMATQGPESWNARVDHFYAVVDRLMRLHGPDARGIVWAHNTHIGDARATSMIHRGQRNIGQLARERVGEEKVIAVGFGTNKGLVLAGRSWGSPMETMTVPAAGPETVECFMQQAGVDSALYVFADATDLAPIRRGLGHRAIGVVYHPEQEYPGNYVSTLLPRRYDAFIFLSETDALRPVL